MTRDHIIVHCSATPPTHDWGAAEINRLHRKAGWLGCGYHEIIRRNGEVENHELGFPTRPLDKAGAHVGDCGPGWNARSIGICLIGGVDADLVPSDNFTAPQRTSLRSRLEHYLALYSGATILGHRDLIKMTGAPPKACPSFSVQSWWFQVWPEDYEPTRRAFPLPTRKPPMTTGQGVLSVRVHKVREGDTLWGLSHVYGQPVATIKRLNKLTDDDIQVGQVLKLT